MTNEEITKLTGNISDPEISRQLVRMMQSMRDNPIDQEAYDKRKAEEEAASRRARVNELRYSWNIPKRHFELKEADRTAEWGAVEKKLTERIGKGYLMALVGVRGAGKTQLGVEVAKETTNRLKSALYCTAMEFFLDIKSSYRKDADRSESDVIYDYTRPLFLIIDEFAKRGETDWENRLLFHVLDKRYQDCKDTLLIVNQEKKDFNEMIGPSLASRMQETGGIIECNWKSYRTKE